MLYMEKKSDGNVFRSEKEERLVAAEWTAARQKQVEAICCRVQKEFETELAEEGTRCVCVMDVCGERGGGHKDWIG